MVKKEHEVMMPEAKVATVAELMSDLPIFSPVTVMYETNE